MIFERIQKIKCYLFPWNPSSYIQAIRLGISMFIFLLILLIIPFYISETLSYNEFLNIFKFSLIGGIIIAIVKCIILYKNKNKE